MPIVSGYNFHGTVTPENVRYFNARYIDTEAPIDDLQVSNGVTSYVKQTIKGLNSGIEMAVIEDLVGQVAACEQQAPLFSGRSFNYPPISQIATDGLPVTTEATFLSAERNLELLTELADIDLYAATSPFDRQHRAVEWSAPLEDTFALRLRGGSGASTVSLDLGLGILDIEANPDNPRYKELWRCGIDTEHDDATGSFGARFIRTGSGVKPGDTFKTEAFDVFRNSYGVMPQKLLGLVGLYAMREINPDYAVALTTEGACNLSTLGKSRGKCDYDGIFASVGFEESPDPHWQVIEDFPDGFFEALDRANLNGREIHSLDMAITALQDAAPTARSTVSEDVVMPITFCSDDSPRTIERELQLYMK